MQDFKMNIPFFDAAQLYRSRKEEFDLAMQNVLVQGTFINGKEVSEFATNLASYLNINHVIPCGNGTDALCLALMALNLNKGDEVILPTFNFIAAAEAVALLGLVPVFVDACANDYHIDSAQIEKVISPKTRAIIVVHLFGGAVEMDEISEIATKYKLYVIEDVAQSLGSEYKNQKLGTIGHMGCTSFFPTKNLACFGDGGAVFTDDLSLANNLKMIANHGQKKKYEHELIGLNSRLDTLQAAILNIQLTQLDENIQARRAIANSYHQHLRALSELQLPIQALSTYHSFNQFCILLPSESLRDGLKAFLSSAGVSTMVYYPKANHMQQAFHSYGYQEGNFPVSENLCQRILALPIFPGLTTDEQVYITDRINYFFKNVS